MLAHDSHLLLHIAGGAVGIALAALLITVVSAVRSHPARPQKRRGTRS